ncbi:hypothetical protein HK099_005161, partial [Clydaea vesicula]
MLADTSPSITRAKLVFLTAATIIFLAYTISTLQNYLSQPPVLNVSIIQADPYNPRTPVPGFLFRLPWGSLGYKSIQDALASQPDLASNNFIKDYPFTTGIQKTNADGTVEVGSGSLPSEIWDITHKSYDNSDGSRGFLHPNYTLYLLKPKNGGYFNQTFDLTVRFSLTNIWNESGIATSMPGSMAQANGYVWILGSRFTESSVISGVNDFGVNVKEFSLDSLPDQMDDSFFAFQNLTKGVVIKDINNFLTFGDLGITVFSISSALYTYANKSFEYFFEFMGAGGSQLLGNLGENGPDGSVIAFQSQMLSYQTTHYTETHSQGATQTIASIMACFHLLLITGFAIFFGRGKYSPYGLVHFILPDTIPDYNTKLDSEIENDVYNSEKSTILDEVNSKMIKTSSETTVLNSSVIKNNKTKEELNFILNEYIDETPIKVISDSNDGTSIMSTFKVQLKFYNILIFLLNFLSIILLGVCCLAGTKIFNNQSLYFVKVEDGSDSYFISLWGYCRNGLGFTSCQTKYDLLTIFSELSVTSTFITKNNFQNFKNWNSLLSDEKNGIGFGMILVVISLLIIIMITRLGSGFVQILRLTETIALPALSLITLLCSFLGMILMLYYYINLRDTINQFTIKKGLSLKPGEFSNNTTAILGNAVYLICFAVFLILLLNIFLYLDKHSKNVDLKLTRFNKRNLKKDKFGRNIDVDKLDERNEKTKIQQEKLNIFHNEMKDFGIISLNRKTMMDDPRLPLMESNSEKEQERQVRNSDSLETDFVLPKLSTVSTIEIPDFDDSK